MQGVPASVTERHIEIFFQHARNDGRSAVFLIMLMVRDAGRVDFKMIEQRTGHARILGGDEVAVPERLQRPRTDIGQVANRRGDNKKTRHVYSSDSV